MHFSYYIIYIYNINLCSFFRHGLHLFEQLTQRKLFFLDLRKILQAVFVHNIFVEYLCLVLYNLWEFQENL